MLQDNADGKLKSVHKPPQGIPIFGVDVSINSVSAILAYAITSLAIILFNKMILSVYRFKFEALLTLGHMISCVVFSEMLRAMGLIKYPSFKVEIAKKVAPLSILFVLNVVIGLIALRVVNVPIFTTLRRLSGLFILIGEFVFLGMKPSSVKVASLSVILFGAVIAGYGDLAFDWLSYSYVIVNNVFTAAYLIMIKKLDQGPKLDAFGKVFYNSLVAIPWLFIIAYCNGEMHAIMRYEFLHDTGFQMAFMFSCVLAFMVNAATFWCTSATNALTTSVTGQCKNILTTFMGMFLFGDVRPNNTLITGLTVGIFGSVWFSYAETTKDAGKRNKNLEQSSPLKRPLAVADQSIRDIEAGEKVKDSTD